MTVLLLSLRCHTDNLVQHGGIPSAFPAIFGHEGAGRVEAVGSAVTRVQEGDSVLLSFATCGECAYCKADRPAGCSLFWDKNFMRVRSTAVGDEPVGQAVATGDAVYGASHASSGEDSN